MTDPHHLVAASQPLWAASADGLVLVDDAGNILATNESFDRLFGHGPEDLLGEPIEAVVPREHRTAHVKLRVDFEAAPVSRPMAASRHLVGLRADGSTFPINVSLGQLETATGTHTFATVRDLTDRIRIELDAATAKRQHAMALERERIAHDLHDTVIQRLFALGLTLEALPPQADADLGAKIFSAVDTIDDIIDDLRSTIYGLRHRLSADAPVRDRIFSVIDEMQQSLGFTPTITMSGPVELVSDPAVSDHLTAVIREALSNIARHANATEAQVSIDLDDSVIRVEVTDNGVGLKENVVRSGLANLADRAVALDGSFEVRRRTPAGTVLRWSVPSADAIGPGPVSD